MPDLYRLARNKGRCLLCGVNVALQEVLGEDKEGAHLVLVTWGGPDTLSLGNEAALRQAEYHQVKLSSVLGPRLGLLPPPTAQQQQFYNVQFKKNKVYNRV